MRHHAQQLADRTCAEPLPWSDFLVRRALALADVLEGARSEGSQARLAALIDEGNRLGLRVDTAALREAL